MREISKRKTTEEFIEQMNVLSPDIEIIGEYTGVFNKIRCRCKVDGNEWATTPSHLLRGHRCKECHDRGRTKTRDEFIKELKLINGDVVILGEYKTTNTKIKCKCGVCGSEWDTRPTHLLEGHGCNQCITAKVGKLRAKTHEQFLNDLYKVNKDIEVLTEYKNVKTKLKCKCKIDGYEWNPTPNDLLNGYGCAICSESKGERAVSNILNTNHIKYIREHRFDDCKNLRRLPFDFYLPDHKSCIEYDGIQHFEAGEYFGGIDCFIGVQKRDLIKTNYCKDNGIKLIRIPYSINNIEEYLIERLCISV